MDERARTIAEEWLTPREVVNHLPVATPEQVRVLIRDGQLRAVDVSRAGVRPRYRVKMEWIEEFLLKRRVD